MMSWGLKIARAQSALARMPVIILMPPYNCSKPPQEHHPPHQLSPHTCAQLLCMHCPGHSALPKSLNRHAHINVIQQRDAARLCVCVLFRRVPHNLRDQGIFFF